MSIKNLLGLQGAHITDAEIVAKIRDAQLKNLDYVEFNVDGAMTKVSLPHVHFDSDTDDLGS